MTPLPALMVAPNGARLGKSDHPALPVTLPEITATARACFQAGADGLHLHLRDAHGRHVLDAALYREALAELGRAVPGMAVQVTTESAGCYEPAFQRRLALAAGAGMVSAALREITADGDLKAARKMSLDCRERAIAVQYILYDPGELASLGAMLGKQALLEPGLQILFVLGGHGGHAGDVKMLRGFLHACQVAGINPDWAACAFGRPETACLIAAHRAGGKLRVGFENSFWNADGRRARDNGERVAEIARLIRARSDT